MTGYKSKRAAALDEEGMYLVHQTDHSEDNLHMVAQEREVLEMALEALEKAKRQIVSANVAPHGCIKEAVIAVKKALAQPAQEPVAWQFMNGSTFRKRRPEDFSDLAPDGFPYWKPLYTAPPAPQRPWVGLTDEEIDEVESWVEFKEEGSDRIQTPKLIRYIETKLKEKNNG